MELSFWFSGVKRREGFLFVIWMDFILWELDFGILGFVVLFLDLI